MLLPPRSLDSRSLLSRCDASLVQTFDDGSSRLQVDDDHYLAYINGKAAGRVGKARTRCPAVTRVDFCNV